MTIIKCKVKYRYPSKQSVKLLAFISLCKVTICLSLAVDSSRACGQRNVVQLFLVSFINATKLRLAHIMSSYLFEINF